MEGCFPEPLQDCAYLYDGSLEGLLSAVFESYARRELSADIVDGASYEPRLGQSALAVPTDRERALRVRRAVERAGGRRAFRWVVEAFLCDDYDRGMAVGGFIRYLMQRERRDGARAARGVLAELSHPAVAPVHRLRTKALNEAEKMRQFIRFSHLENGVWFARCNPSVSVVPLVMGHFAARLNDQPFIIYDEVHQLAGFYDGRSWCLAEGVLDEPAAPTARDRQMQEAWRCFYDALCVDARYNPELRRSFMPQRLWRNLPEMMPASEVPSGRALRG